MRYSPRIQACEPPRSQIRIPPLSICHLGFFEHMVMLTTLRFPRSTSASQLRLWNVDVTMVIPVHQAPVRL
jgi:hypothetical protein